MQLTQIKETKNDILSCIGHTPLVRFNKLFLELNATVYGKLEMLNPGGSIKDRTAHNIIRHAMNLGKINANSVIIESTSGNMGIGLARICHFYGLKLFLVTDPHINPLAEKILRTFNAEIVKVSTDDGTGGYLNSRLKKVEELLQAIPNSFWPDQYHNMDNPAAHEQTFKEIVEDLGAAPDYLFIPTSTCGTLRGFADAIQQMGVHTRIVAVDAEGSLIFKDKPSPRLIPGMGASRKSHFLKQDHVHNVVHVSDTECVAGCHQLLAQESILAGGSSGAVVKAIASYQQKFLPGQQIVAIIPDNGERYLDTIYSTEWLEKHGLKKD
ncbi:2,3-diaminopropionate biosynthesis protein SbnA [Sphingobacterium corticibacter]|uniref:N-(2-amino-2-carboxyethyl)-L-glutamate synthase n=1 Tax=Sphingobacterium corticibacter TaxID=2171749 RepID=A0A2T8HID4_9SPHI|nr:2,3-diaminopropionate biosynthesis protein SbnA [Sphingobacterium corticibacter]PVH25199.1 2,3-diaminopropionate biosynthesis protein SbnA [Sphingobacterium corticibacter]